MFPTEIAYKIEDLELEAKKVSVLQSMIFEVYSMDSEMPEKYEWAFSVLGELIEGLEKGLGELVKESFAVMRQEG